MTFETRFSDEVQILKILIGPPRSSKVWNGIFIGVPPSDDCRDHSCIDEVFDAAVCKVEILGVHYAEVIGFVVFASLIFPASIKSSFIGIRPADDLDHAKILGLANGSQFLKSFQVIGLEMFFHQVSTSQRNSVPSVCSKCFWSLAT